MEALDLYHSVPDYKSVCGISGNLNLPAPAVEVLNKWLADNNMEVGDDTDFLRLLEEQG